MKWKEFKKKLEKAGVKDEDEIAYIDVWYFGSLDIEKVDAGWAIQD